MWTNEGAAIYLTADKSETVDENDPRARWLLVASGGQIPLEEAERYGLPGTNTAKEKAEKPAEKAKADAPANKLMSEKPPNKGKA